MHVIFDPANERRRAIHLLRNRGKVCMHLGAEVRIAQKRNPRLRREDKMNMNGRMGLWHLKRGFTQTLRGRSCWAHSPRVARSSQPRAMWTQSRWDTGNPSGICPITFELGI